MRGIWRHFQTNSLSLCSRILKWPLLDPSSFCYLCKLFRLCFRLNIILALVNLSFVFDRSRVRQREYSQRAHSNWDWHPPLSQFPSSADVQPMCAPPLSAKSPHKSAFSDKSQRSSPAVDFVGSLPACLTHTRFVPGLPNTHLSTRPHARFIARPILLRKGSTQTHHCQSILHSWWGGRPTKVGCRAGW